MPDGLARMTGTASIDRMRALGRDLLRSSIISLAVRLLGMGVTFLVGVQLARALGPSGFGVYAIVMASVAILAVLAQLGLPQLITRELSTRIAEGRPGQARRALITFPMVILVSSGLLVVTVSFAVHLWTPPQDAAYGPAIVWGVAAVPLMALFSLGLGALRGLHLVIWAQALEALIRPGAACILLALLGTFTRFDAAGAIAVHCLACLLGIAACAWLLYQAVPEQVRASGAEETPTGWAKSSASMASTELLRVLDGQYAMLLLGFLATQDDVGIYRVAVSLGAFVSLPSSLLNVIVMPQVAQMHARDDRAGLQFIAARSAAFAFLGTLAISVLLYTGGEKLITFAFGRAYVAAWMPLMVICAAYLISSFFGSAAAILNMCGEERTVTWVFALGPTIGVATVLKLFASIGILSGAAGLAIAELAKGICMAWRVRYRLGVDATAVAALASVAQHAESAKGT